MALLTTAKRKEYFKYLGLGTYTKANIQKFEKKYLPSKYCDGEYGSVTDNLLRHCYNVKKFTTNFSPGEFRCKCGKCSGYPSYMKENELKNLQAIRTKFKKPMTITSGMRCKSYNSSLKGSSATSKHLTGMAADFYIAGVTDTVARRKTLIAYLKTLPRHNWSYGDGWCSKGYVVNAPNMGNAVHLDTLNGVALSPACAQAYKLIQNKFGYCYYKNNKNYPKNSGNCIRFVACCLNGAGINVSTKQDGLLNDAYANNLYKLCAAGKKDKALELWGKRNGGVKLWNIIWNSGSKIPVGKLKPDDVLLCFNGKTYKHTALKYSGDSIADCNPTKGAKIRAYTKTKDKDGLNNPCKIAFRYVGK